MIRESPKKRGLREIIISLNLKLNDKFKIDKIPAVK